MATPSVSNAFITQFEDQVILAYQQQGSKLQGTVRRKPGIVGEKVRFQKITTKAEAEQKTTHGDIPVQELTHSYGDATIADWFAAMYADQTDLDKLNIDERDALNKNGAYCIGRKIDSILIDVMDGSSTYVGTYAEVMGVTMALAAFDKLNAADVPDDGDRFVILSSHAWAEMLAIDQFNRADWVGADRLPWTQGTQAKRYLNMVWMMHTGLPLASSDNRTCFMFHKWAVGLGQTGEIASDFWWDGRKQSWLITNKVGAGAVLIDTTGVVEIRLDDDTAISTPMDKLIAATEANA